MEIYQYVSSFENKDSSIPSQVYQQVYLNFTINKKYTFVKSDSARIISNHIVYSFTTRMHLYSFRALLFAFFCLCLLLPFTISTTTRTPSSKKPSLIPSSRKPTSSPTNPTRYPTILATRYPTSALPSLTPSTIQPNLYDNSVFKTLYYYGICFL